MVGARSKIAPISKLPSSFYRNLNTQELARELLGKQLVHIHRGKRYSGIIVETEAYLGVDDPACHTYKNKQTKRTQAMYLPGGHSYIYLIYGMYLCFNVVAKNQGEPEAVLIRALDPRENLTGRTDGPGRLSKAMKFHIRQSGISLSENKIFIENMPRIPDGKIAVTSRVGVDYAGEAAHWPLRFYLLDNPHVSRVKLTRNKSNILKLKE